MKVKIMQRSIYHKIAKVEVEIPDDVQDIHQYLIDNSELYDDSMDYKTSHAPYKFGFGLGKGMDEKESESECRYECEQLKTGGHL